SLVFDLADPLAGDVEGPPDLAERERSLAAESVAKLEHAALAVGDAPKRVSQSLLGQDLDGALVGRLGMLIGDHLAQFGFLVVPDGRLERDRHSRRALDRLDALRLDPRDLRDLLDRRVTTEPSHEGALSTADPVYLLDDMDRDPDRASLVRPRPRDRLAD